MVFDNYIVGKSYLKRTAIVSVIGHAGCTSSGYNVKGSECDGCLGNVVFKYEDNSIVSTCAHGDFPIKKLYPEIVETNARW